MIDLRDSIDILWLLVAAGLVFLMQAGFAALESGMTRAKNSINVAVKNLVDLTVNGLLFWAVGFAMMFGASAGGIIGTTHFFAHLQQDPHLATFFLFQMMFSATAATIVSGAVSERMKLSGYIFAVIIISTAIYPVFGSWVWSGAEVGEVNGWLAKTGFFDFAGSTVVHSVGGWVALAALIVIGPRIGRFGADGTVNRIQGSNIPMSVLGVVLIWLGWFGFNGGSTLALNEYVPIIILNTTLAGSAGAVAALGIAWSRGRSADAGELMNGSLAGLVAITAAAILVEPYQAVLIGAIGGAVMYAAERLLERLRIDDAIGAVPVHLAAGIWGTLAVGIMGDLDLIGSGLNRWEQVGVQALGITVAGGLAFGVAFSALKAIDRWRTIRVTVGDEEIGLNVSEHDAPTETLELLRAMDHQARNPDLAARVPVEPFTEVGRIALRYNEVMSALDIEANRRITLEKIASATSSSLSLSEALRLVEPLARVIIPEARITVYTTDGKADLVRHSRSANSFSASSPEFDESLAKMAIDSGRPSLTRISGSASSQTEACVSAIPLKTNGEKVGAALISFDSAGRDSEEIAAICRNVADRMAVPVANAIQHAREIKLIEERIKLESENKSLEELNAARTELLSNVSHELKTPLTSVLAFTSILSKNAAGNLTDRQMQQIEVMRRNSERLGVMINDLLDLSRDELGRLSMEVSDMDITELTDELSQSFEPVMGQRNQSLVYHRPDEEIMMRGDRTRMAQVVSNLLSNASKYSGTDTEVTLTLGKRDESIVIEVTDQGIGISPEDQRHLFSTFFRAENEETRSVPGAGLGLSITQRIVERHDGKITVQSERGKGSTFTVTLKPDADFNAEAA